MLTVIELNLRLPSMLHGKKGFERIVWAFKNVLNSAVTWLFYDPEGSKGSSAAVSGKERLCHCIACLVVAIAHIPIIPEYGPLAPHHPVRITCKPCPVVTASIKLPDSLGGEATPWPSEDFEDWVIGISEWLSLAALQSPRIERNDKIDPYLCRYSPPGGPSTTSDNLVCICWSGFIPAQWLRNLFMALV